MTFGSDQTFSLIQEILLQDNGEAYEPLCQILFEDVEMLINKYCQGVQTADKEDLRQEIVWNVLRDLPNFYEKSQNNTEQQRNKYLKSMTHNACMDFFRKAKRSVLTNASDINDPAIHAVAEDFSKRIVDRELFLDALKGAFSINTTPDKLLAFVYNRLLGTMSGKNGKPKEIIGEFDSIPIQKMYEQMVSDLSHVLGISLPAEVLSPLRERVYGEFYDSVFHMSAHQIADSSKWIVEKVKEQNKYE